MERKSNIELLRIIAMLAIVLHHCQGQLKIVGFRQDKNVGFRQ